MRAVLFSLAVVALTAAVITADTPVTFLGALVALLLTFHVWCRIPASPYRPDQNGGAR